MRRSSRACVRCRRHKAKCVLERSGHILEPPCKKCVQAGVECVLASSNRGGLRRRRNDVGGGVDLTPTTGHQRSNIDAQDIPGFVHDGNFDISADIHQTSRIYPVRPTVIDDTFNSADLHGTSDALNILSQLADNARPSGSHGSQSRSGSTTNGLQDFYLVRTGQLTCTEISNLLDRYATAYHSFYPIAPLRFLNTAVIPQTAREAPHLLTAMITIAASSTRGGIPKACARYMQSLLTELNAGKRCTVEAIEALLLIAEWEPELLLPGTARPSCGQEDMAAWMHIGTAIRIAQALRLDRVALKREGMDEQTSRERLVWMACYLSDRQISVRLGRPFACRGMEPTILYGRYGFPTVDLQCGEGENFATVFRARLELTQIFTNVHEILYCGMDNGNRSMVLGNYTTYLDDFKGAIAAWHSVWGSLTCPSNVKILLLLSYEYLRLYTNAFAFQAAAQRSPSTGSLSDNGIDCIGGPGALPEARFLYEAIDAAKSLLIILNNYVPPGESIHYFPVRFPLYCVNGAVFLYKTWIMNLLSAPEKASVRLLITDTINRLRDGTTRPSGLGPRYAGLLGVLWKRTDTPSRDENFTTPGVGDTTRQRLPSLDRYSWLESGFSWLDLEAIGDFVWGDTSQLENMEFTNT
ncbi:hypothetical protein BJY01DRAFT_164315 [Aspergillus pseudoustus]|uniref:Zn(2)-C6 fungal-type domain-containing protein n=1 Tax=Aspergillus pseudoustus TaxID=1810923 RepID=A0ABR4K635_9EURO